MQGCETAEASYTARGWEEQRRGMGGAAQGYGWGGAGGWAERREGMGGVARGDGRSSAGGWEEWRRSMGGVRRSMGGAEQGDRRNGAGVWVERREGMGELRGNGSSSNEKDAVLKGRTRRLQTLNSVWKGNYCSGIGDGGAIKSTKQREASAVPYRFVMVIPSVMKLSSPK